MFRLSINTFQRENKKLMQSNMRLEIENDDLANELNTQTNTLETQLQKVRFIQHLIVLFVF